MSNRLVTMTCGPCGARVVSVVFERTGLRGEIERAPGGAGDLALVLELPGVADGDAPPRVTPSRGGGYREHRCPARSPSFSAANFNRKRREP